MANKNSVMKKFKLVIYSGIVAYFFLVITVIYGVLEIDYRLHKILGILTFVFSSLHLGMVIWRRR